VSEEPAAFVCRVEDIALLVRTVRAMEQEGLLILELGVIQREDCRGKHLFSKGEGTNTNHCVYVCVCTFVCTLHIYRQSICPLLSLLQSSGLVHKYYQV